MSYWQEQQNRIKEAASEFPETFSLRAFPNKTFRVNVAASFINDNGDILLYTDVKQKDDTWMNFAKGTVKELKSQLR